MIETGDLSNDNNSESKGSAEEETRVDVTKLRSMKLKKEELKESNWSRVKIEALDFDWIFNEDNSITLLHVLNGLEDSSIFSRKSIQILIQMFWNIYQPEILKKVLVPYLLYVLSFIMLQPYIDVNFESQYGQLYSPTIFYIKMAVLFALFLYFLKFEVAQFKENPWNYLTDSVNMFDMAQYLLNFAIIVMFCSDFYH